ncbi:unnamed protein product [Candidula unifasciata]|uniref:Uncharacterized protein n=1 Tax=Candidula unifasciata TaxID=100452 RepID=A0A8S3YSG9_9EUPU|nr:unnamed protein product [Candidula unifasciata]
MADTKDIEKTSYRKKPPLPVDRGWAWCVMIGIYVIMLILVAFGRSLSIFLPDILDRYKEPAAVTTLAFGMSDICWSVTNIVMPVLLLPRFNVRTLVLTGAFCQCFGVIALAYSPNIIVFNCLFGVLGMAAALMIGPSMIHLGQYFKKRLSFASSVTHVGGSTSTVLVPRLAQFLKEMYGYQGAMLILGGVSFHCVAAAMLLWPVSMFDDTDHTKEVQDKSSENDIQPLLDINGVQMEFNIRPQEQDKKEEIDDASNNKETNGESRFLQVQDLNNVQIKQLNSTADLKTSKGDINRQLQFERNDDTKNSPAYPVDWGKVFKSYFAKNS